MDTTVENTPKLKQNLDTNFLKLIAILAMTIDHAGKIFFPQIGIFQVIGRIAFPLFAYCIAVGCVYTHDIKKYMLRLGIFAVIAQPFFNMAFHPTWKQFLEEFTSLNIMFTLLAGVLVIDALMNFKKNWWMLIIALSMEFFIGLDYGTYGLIMIALFYLCRRKSWLSLGLVFLWMCSMMRGDFLQIGGFGLDTQFFAVLALPFIYIHTNFRPKINKYFFYVFYPLHLLIIFIIRLALGV